LARGIRFFDLRIRAHDSVFFIHHGPTPTHNDLYTSNGTEILADVRDFVRRNPHEIVILHCWDLDSSSQGGSGFSSKAARNKAFVQLIDQVFNGSASKGSNVGKLIPRTFTPKKTVGGMLAKGNVIVIVDFALPFSVSKVQLWRDSSTLVD
jgi:hypothetical protein